MLCYLRQHLSFQFATVWLISRGNMKHVFVISAYGDSPYLEECVRSLRAQTEPSAVLLCTSTPSEFLKDMAEKYELSYHVREGQSGLKADWNFCIEMAVRQGAQLVTIAHQDDVYLPDFAKEVKNAAGPDTSLIFTAAENIDACGNPIPGKAEKVKRILRLPLRIGLGRFAFGRRLSIAYGNSVPCPACTYNTAFFRIPQESIFSANDRFTIDWRALLELSKKPGSFIYIPKPLVRIRLHAGAETVKTMQESIRQKEELEMFRAFHPEPVAKLLMHFYSGAADSYGK